MRAVGIILANSQFVPAFFLKLKIHKIEIDNFFTFFVDVLLFFEKNLKIAIYNFLKNWMLGISRKQNSNLIFFVYIQVHFLQFDSEILVNFIIL